MVPYPSGMSYLTPQAIYMARPRSEVTAISDALRGAAQSTNCRRRPMAAGAKGSFTVLLTRGEGAEPRTGPVSDGAGNLYGTTFSGGNNSVGACNTVDTRLDRRLVLGYVDRGGQHAGSGKKREKT
jgi:hypothetical protein